MSLPNGIQPQDRTRNRHDDAGGRSQRPRRLRLLRWIVVWLCTSSRFHAHGLGDSDRRSLYMGIRLCTALAVAQVEGSAKTCICSSPAGSEVEIAVPVRVYLG